MHIHCFQHAPFETPGTILEWAKQNKHLISFTYFFQENFSMPALEEIDALLIMGGSMNVDEEEQFLWLKAEKQFIKQAIDAGKKVLGICLGSQLIAAALGARVYKGNQNEIGFFPINFTNEALLHPLFNHFTNPYTLFHWHGDTFDLPVGAQLIASTEVCKHQAYLIGNHVVGLQFHLEMNEIVIEEMLLHDGNELTAQGTYIQSTETIGEHYANLLYNKQDMFTLLNKFLV